LREEEFEERVEESTCKDETHINSNSICKMATKEGMYDVNEMTLEDVQTFLQENKMPQEDNGQKEISDIRKAIVVEDEEEVRRKNDLIATSDANIEANLVEDDKSDVDIEEIAEVLRDQEIEIQLKNDEIEKLQNYITVLSDKEACGKETKEENDTIAITIKEKKLLEENEKIRYQNALVISRLEQSENAENELMKEMRVLKETMAKSKAEIENKIKSKEEE